MSTPFNIQSTQKPDESIKISRFARKDIYVNVFSLHYIIRSVLNYTAWLLQSTQVLGQHRNEHAAKLMTPCITYPA